MSTLREAAQAQPAQETVAWIRVHPDGTYTDDILPEWRIEQVRRDSGGWVRLVRGDSPAPTSATVSEPMFLVHAGGDSYQSSIVPESKLDDAYLLTQWGSLDDITDAEMTEALEHFHDDDSWTHEEVTGHGKRVKFSLSLEDGWVEVVRLPAERAAEPGKGE